MKKLNFIICSLFIIQISSCEDKNKKDCIDESKISNSPCIEIYDPVCGCDEQTYSNYCYAEIAGVNDWSSGECK